MNNFPIDLWWGYVVPGTVTLFSVEIWSNFLITRTSIKSLTSSNFSHFVQHFLVTCPWVIKKPNIFGIVWGIAPSVWGGWVRQRCRVSCVTRASNWYWHIVGQGLLSLQQVGIEGECFYFCFFTFIHFPLSSLSLSFISSTISLLPFSGRQHKMTHKGWRVVKPHHNKRLQFWSQPLQNLPVSRRGIKSLTLEFGPG